MEAFGGLEAFGGVEACGGKQAGKHASKNEVLQLIGFGWQRVRGPKFGGWGWDGGEVSRDCGGDRLKQRQTFDLRQRRVQLEKACSSEDCKFSPCYAMKETLPESTCQRCRGRILAKPGKCNIKFDKKLKTGATYDLEKKSFETSLMCGVREPKKGWVPKKVLARVGKSLVRGAGEPKKVLAS